MSVEAPRGPCLAFQWVAIDDVFVAAQWLDEIQHVKSFFIFYSLELACHFALVQGLHRAGNFQRLPRMLFATYTSASNIC